MSEEKITKRTKAQILSILMDTDKISSPGTTIMIMQNQGLLEADQDYNTIREGKITEKTGTKVLEYLRKNFGDVSRAKKIVNGI